MASADSLSASARVLYEQTKYKMVLSIVLGAGSLISLAYCSAYGGQSNSANYLADQYKSDNDDNLEESQDALAGGYGFASFLWILAFVMLLSAAIYVSPLLCGSANEKKMLSGPQEPDSSYASGAPPPTAQATEVPPAHNKV
mmetsp:Transcript_11063/g.18074  ORF Transcript_11063/g.18074 Transcript_11063/m.18074 type:complete len:142 (-) Transcript_11063:1829-2254(-)|eukprot:CAMPEP_0174981036 /NCGR_PEP_ID=MMETSP0004_2-20121128/15668_1 /TAXON_ID=420556 /ORGANISM="Ochromonas sp., Strain CCMP1393" /LENGTH=141 /DNA_ID=CAMNT_0016232739 /DNA_START=1230 /DNA_END=1655 /DNA_ORIENTATION=-